MNSASLKDFSAFPLRQTFDLLSSHLSFFSVYRHRDVLTLLLPICRHWLLLSDSEKTIGCPPPNIGWKHLLSPETNVHKWGQRQTSFSVAAGHCLNIKGQYISWTLSSTERFPEKILHHVVYVVTLIHNVVFYWRKREKWLHRPVHPQRHGPTRGPGGVQWGGSGRHSLLQQGRASYLKEDSS